MSWSDDLPDLRGLGPIARARLATYAPVEVPAGAVLFRPGDTVRGYVIVLEGRVGVHLVGPTGRDILLYDVTPGKSCIQSTLGLLGGEDYSAEAVADRPTRLVLLPRVAFLDLIDTDPAFRALVFAAFAERMQSMMQLLERVAFQRVEARLAGWLLAHADADGRIVATQQEIASAIGSAREVVSRRLDALSRSGAIETRRGEVRLVDRDRLRRLAEDMAI
ncbi:Crp/Fnr family transcriptional regulator [Palleronia sp. KMU-117]|uniref:Crp/Fnr family transcriptional regulator n=1 Tax=Palleronia sp. KMU-117 TaxID=3434108 RepID=UPI003D751887